jgi:hypothetical protein
MITRQAAALDFLRSLTHTEPTLPNAPPEGEPQIPLDSTTRDKDTDTNALLSIGLSENTVFKLCTAGGCLFGVMSVVPFKDHARSIKEKKKGKKNLMNPYL